MKQGYNTAFTFSSANSKTGNLHQLAGLMPHGGILRMPGGTSSFYYDCSAPGYGQKTGNKYTNAVHSENYIWDFINLCKLTNSTACVVLNVQRHFTNKSLDGWENTILPLLTIMSSVKVEGVELGNESYLYSGVANVNNRNVNLFKKSIQDYITPAKFFNAKCKELGLKTGVPTESVKSLRGRTWNNAVLEIGADAIIPHLYASNVAEITTILDSKLNWKHGKEVWITEAGYNFGFDQSTNLDKYGTNIHKEVLKQIPIECEKRKVNTCLRHSLCQDISSPYPLIGEDKGNLVLKF